MDLPMRYVQLRAFHHVALCGGFSRAAEMLRLTQPAVSDQVRRLEEEYDVLLFNRIRKQITLTPEGEALLRITRRMFDNEREALELLTEGRAFRAGNLRIIADSAHHLVGVLSAFRRRHPMVRIHVQTGNSDAVTTALRRYEADVGVLGDVPDSAEFDLIPLGRSRIVAFAARTHPLAGRAALAMADLPSLPLVLREEGSRTRAMLEHAAAEAGVILNPVIVAEGREAVREIVAAGAGIGFVSLAEFGEDRRLVRIELRDGPRMDMDETLICLPERRHSKLVSAFLDLARAAQSQPPNEGMDASS
jgi:LysR family transcriptional regulator, low CO2-responsive transcriptional regulator